MSGEIILETEDLTKEFAGFVAVNGVGLRVARGTIHALIGPNGAGKTTCFNLLTKFLSPSRGRIVFKGRDITALPPAEVARLGLVRSFQISAVFPHLTVLENVRIALQRRRGGSFDFWRSRSVLDTFNDRATALIADVGLASFADALAVELPDGRKRGRDRATTLPCVAVRHAAARRSRPHPPSRPGRTARRRRPRRRHLGGSDDGDARPAHRLGACLPEGTAGPHLRSDLPRRPRLPTGLPRHLREPQ